MGSLEQLCRICSDDLKDEGVGIFSPECMEKLVGEKIKRYLYFSVSIMDQLPKKVCPMCLKKLDSIHRFAKMAAEMQEKFRMLLAQEETTKPKIKLRNLDELKQEVNKDDSLNQTEEVSENNQTNGVRESGEEDEEEDDIEMSFDVACEEVGDSNDAASEEVTDTNQDGGTDPKPDDSSAVDLPDEVHIKMENHPQEGEEEEEDDIDCDHSQEDEKPNASLLHSLLLKGKGKLRTSMDIDHDYLMPVKEEPPNIKEEPADPEDEDIAEEIEEDRLNQIIKDEMDSETEGEEYESNGSDIEVTEMEVKVDPMLYFSNTSQSAIELDPDSQDSHDFPKLAPKPANSSSATSATEGTTSSTSSPLVMTRSQQRTNPVIASLKLGKPYKCTVCPRSFITDIGLQNHLWSHLPKARKSGGHSTNVMIHKNVDLEDSQVYSSNGVLHTAMPSENPHLLKYVCPICGKKISTKGNLKVHLETHRPKGKYGCDICGRVFKTAANLYRHKDYHGGVQFPCGVCGRVYPTNSTLRAHSITHSDLRPHKCPLCSKTFKRNQDLKFHINQHTGARPYQCPYCPKAFASSGNCFSHRKRMHPMEVERDKERAAEIMG